MVWQMEGLGMVCLNLLQILPWKASEIYNVLEKDLHLDGVIINTRDLNLTEWPMLFLRVYLPS